MNDDSQEDNLGKKVQEATAEATEADEASATQETSVQPTAEPKDAKIEELTAALARAMADLQNFKRRSEEDRGRFARFAGAEVIKAILPTVDNFDRSASHLPEELKGDKWAQGVISIHDEMLKALEKMGVKKMKTVGEKLNPNLHEALMSGPGDKDMITE